MRHVTHKVTLGGVSLAAVDSRIVVISAQEIEPKETRSTMPFGGRDGGYITERRRDELTVRVEFAIRERNDHAVWTRALMAARSWCGDGKLTVSDRPGQYLEVVCTKLPTPGKKIFDTMTAEFTAFAVPYWRSENANSVSADANESGQLWVPGDGIDTPVDVEFTASAATTDLIVAAGNSSIRLTGISLAADDTVIFGHDNNGFLSIKAGTVSLLNKRTAESSDDLVIPSGATSEVSVTTGTAVFSARGCYR